MIIEGFYERGKFAEEQHKIEMKIKKAKTIEIFKGSGIIETLERIRDSQALVFATINSSEQIGSIYGTKEIPINQIIPAKIIYSLNKVSLMYDTDFFDKNKELPIEFEFCEITVEKIDDIFIFKGIGKTLTGNAKETINNVAEFVEKHEPFHADYVKQPDNRPLIGYSKDIDDEYCV